MSVSHVKTLIKHLLVWRRGYEDVWKGTDILGVWARGALKNR